MRALLRFVLRRRFLCGRTGRAVPAYTAVILLTVLVIVLWAFAPTIMHHVSCAYSGYIIRGKQLSFSQFSWPYDGDILDIVKGHKERRADVIEPPYPLEYPFLIENDEACETLPGDTLLFIYLVKSTVVNFNKRRKIRSSWGKTTKNGRHLFRTLFIVGSGWPDDGALAEQIHREQVLHTDLIQGHFVDSYRNNTVKTIMSYHWVTRHCNNAKFVVFVDDDMSVDTPNVIGELTAQTRITETDEHFFTGLLTGTENSPPVPYRDKCSKWSVPLEVYPYDQWPLYVHGGFYMASAKTVSYVAMAMLYTKPLWIDDAYVGIVLHKLGIKIRHCSKIITDCDAYYKFHLWILLSDKTLLSNHCDLTFKV